MLYFRKETYHTPNNIFTVGYSQNGDIWIGPFNTQDIGFVLDYGCIFWLRSVDLRNLDFEKAGKNW